MPAAIPDEDLRFRVDVVDASGRLLQRQRTDSAEQAMRAFVGLTQTDFGKVLGRGAYIALADNELKLDAAKTIEGPGVYSMRFGKEAGRAAYEAIVPSPPGVRYPVDRPDAPRRSAPPASRQDRAASTRTSAENEISANVPLAVDDASTARLRREAIARHGGQGRPHADAARTGSSQTGEPEPLAGATIGLMNREELQAYQAARRAGSGEIDKVLLDASKRIESLAERPHRWAARPPLEDRFNVVDRLGQRVYESRTEPGKVAFTERWLSMTTSANSPAIVKAMVDRAEERGWSTLQVAGAGEFKRLAWTAADARGIQVVGYEPTPGDRTLAKQEQERLAKERGGWASGTAKRPTATERASVQGETETMAGHPSVMRALEHVMAEKAIPEAQRERARRAVQLHIDALDARGQAVKVKVFDASAPRPQRVARDISRQRGESDRTI